MARDRGGKGPTVSAEEGSLLATVRNLWSYMWPADRTDLKLRVILAIGALLVSKVATTFVPFAYKGIIDSLDGTTPEGALVLGLAVPIVLVVAYGIGNIIDAGFQQLRDVLFASVGQHAVRKLALQTFQHLHRLSLRFHLARRTGGLSRVIERGTKGIETIVRFTMLNTAPTLVEFVITGDDLHRDVRRQLPRRAGRHDLALPLLHHQGLELAHLDPPRHERERHRRQLQGDRQPAQLRDGEVLRQRGDGGRPLRRVDGEATSARRSASGPRSASSTSARR